MFFRNFVRDAKTALKYNPGLVFKITGMVAGTFATIGACGAAGQNYMDSACYAGAWVLNNAKTKYNCIATGDPCPKVSEVSTGEPLTTDCHGNKTAEALLKRDYNIAYDAYPTDYIRVAIAATVGFFIGSFVGFVVGVRCASTGEERRDSVPTARTPLITHSLHAPVAPTMAVTVNDHPEGVNQGYQSSLSMRDMS